MSGIRLATLYDLKNIRTLLLQLEYTIAESVLENTLALLLAHPDALNFVYEENQEVVALLSMHFIPQIAFEGSFARISYFVVDENIRGKGIGQEMESLCEEEARKRRCDRIEVHCHTRREKAHHFYKQRGYEESPKYFIKHL